MLLRHPTSDAAERTAGWVLVAAGVALIVSALITFRRVGTTPNPTKPATAFATTGPYRFTRNPMYLGWALAYLGGVLLSNTLWPLVLLPLVLVVVHHAVILKEERYLERTFGDAYRDYRKRVRRWL